MVGRRVVRKASELIADADGGYGIWIALFSIAGAGWVGFAADR